MMPVDFEGTNISLVKPRDMTDEQCSEIRAFRSVDNDGFPFFLTAWQPNKEDIEAINAGRPVMLKVLGESTPPIAMYTFDEDFSPNI